MTRINFDQETNGYNREQVDRYIEKVEKEYRGLMEECRRMEEQFREQKETLEAMRQQRNGEAAVSAEATASAEVVAAVMIKAELVASQTKADAKEEAEMIRASARRDAEEIVCRANEEVKELRQSKEQISAELIRLGELIRQINSSMNTQMSPNGNHRK